MAPSPTLQVVSDIHLDAIPGDTFRYGWKGFAEILQPSADILCLVGNIGKPFKGCCPLLMPFLQWCSYNWKHVLYLPGNCCYHNKLGVPMYAIDEYMELLCCRFPNVYYMNNRTRYIMGEKFVGSTLWSYIPYHAVNDVSSWATDYKMIYKYDGICVEVEDINRLYLHNVAYLERAIGDCVQQGFRPIVLTHHIPTFEGALHPSHRGTKLIYTLGSNLTTCTPGMIKLWCCGHSNFNFDIITKSFRVLSNQMGSYPPFVEGYNPAMCITV